MARVSLSLSLAFTFVLGTLLSASATAPAPTLAPASVSVDASLGVGKDSAWRSMIPETVMEAQTFPFVELQKFLARKSIFAPENKEFNEMFQICADYLTFLYKMSSLPKAKWLDHDMEWKEKFAAMDNAILAAQVSVRVSGKQMIKLRKSYAAIVDGFSDVPEKISEISMNHRFDATAKISLEEQNDLCSAIMILKKSIDEFMDVACEVDEKGHAGKYFGGGSKGSFRVQFNEKKRMEKKHEMRNERKLAVNPFFTGNTHRKYLV